MKLNVVVTVFKKEIIDLLRDRRTLLSMVVLPVIVFPLVFGVMGRFMGDAEKKAESEATTVAIAKGGIPSQFDRVISRSGLKIVEVPDVTAAVEKKDASTIDSVKAYCSQNQTEYLLTAPLLCDTSGDGVVGFLAG